MTRGIYVLHTPKPNEYNVYKVGMSTCIEMRKDDVETILPDFDIKMSRIYELHDWVDLRKYEGMLHDMLEKRGYKRPNKVEHFNATLDDIDECATEMFMKHPEILKKVHNEDHTPTLSRKSMRASDNSRAEEALTNFDKMMQEEASTSQTTTPYGDFKLRDDQNDLMKRLYQHFMEDNNPRGQIHLPPGYGKTEIGCCLFPVVNKLKRVLIQVPTIKLAEETMRRIKAFHVKKLNITYYKYFEVHSNSTSFDFEAIANSNFAYVVAVYNSVTKLQGTKPFDIIICDEAHRTSIKCQVNDSDDEQIDTIQEQNTYYTFAMVDDNIQATYRLFMTATPRFMNNDENSMSNEDKYGKVIFSMSMRQAVKRQIINDYRIWMYVKQTHTRQEDDYTTTPDRLQLLTSFLNESICQKVLTVCSSIKSCDAVAKGIKETEQLTGVYKVHSKMSKRDIDTQIDTFINTSSRSILCAVNMFREGINCPAIDGIVFFDERKSVIDVIQIVGRALRRKPNASVSDIGILCTLDTTKRMDDQSDMRYLRMILQNMFDHSEELSNNLKIIKSDEDNEELATDIDKIVKEVCEEMKDEEDTQHHEQKLENVQQYGEKNFQNARAFAQAQSAFYNWRLKNDWFDYISRAELPFDIPRRPDRVYKQFGWISWDDFLGLSLDKPFDYYTLKYILQKELRSINPTPNDYSELITRYGTNRLISPHEYSKLYGKGFYHVLSDILEISIPFMSFNDLKTKKILEYGRQRFLSTHYDEMLEKEEYCGKLPHYPMTFYDITSFMQV